MHRYTFLASDLLLIMSHSVLFTFLRYLFVFSPILMSDNRPSMYNRGVLYFIAVIWFNVVEGCQIHSNNLLSKSIMEVHKFQRLVNFR